MGDFNAAKQQSSEGVLFYNFSCIINTNYKTSWTFSRDLENSIGSYNYVNLKIGRYSTIMPANKNGTVCPGRSDSFYIVSYNIKKGHYFLGTQYTVIFLLSKFMIKVVLSKILQISTRKIATAECKK